MALVNNAREDINKVVQMHASGLKVILLQRSGRSSSPNWADTLCWRRGREALCLPLKHHVSVVTGGRILDSCYGTTEAELMLFQGARTNPSYVVWKLEDREQFRAQLFPTSLSPVHTFLHQMRH